MVPEETAMSSWENSGGSSVHLLGICGVGMAGLAYLLARRGWQVSGCDACPNALAEWLRASGVAVADGHSPGHLTPLPSRIIITPAVPADNPERATAHAQGLPIFRRGEVLAQILSDGQGVAVCGSHGKTTTACFTAHLFQELGLGPDWCIGGFTKRLGAVAGGTQATHGVTAAPNILVAEADESDGTLALYHPDVTVLTNIDWDHAEHFRNEEELLDCFRTVVRQTRKGVAVCHDHPRARGAVMGNTHVPALTFGFTEGADVRAAAIRDAGAACDVWYQGENWGPLALGVPGRHNILNALGAATAALLMGQPPERVFAALPAACAELPGRRFEEVGTLGGIRFVADYAHHPQELRAAIGMAREQAPGRLVVVFQPHRYSRTLALGALFPEAFEEADEVILLPVYAASEKPLLGGESSDLYAHFRARESERRNQGKDNTASRPFPRTVALARSLDEVWGYLGRALRAGDFVLIAGAGDVIGLADNIRNRHLGMRNPGAFEEALQKIAGLRVTPNGALSAWSFYGAGGAAQWRVEAADETAMAAVLRCCTDNGVPWRMFGRGANAWVSDLGECGCAIRWAEESRSEALGMRNGTEAVVGCGWGGPALLEALTQEGLGGLEFLEGVPGSVGGWLAMNAGAHGKAISRCVKWVRCVHADGTVRVLTADELGFGYRCCEGLKGRVAVSCGLALEQSDSETIRARRMAIREKRLPLAGLRTAGSVFRNPAGDTAGRLLDAAGCKGLRVGGASVTDFHANIIAVDNTAQASDILALAQQMRRRVEQASGVVLEMEVTT